MDIKPNPANKYFTLYFYMVIFFLPLVFIQKCEDAYYLPKLALLAGAIQFFIPVLYNLKSLKLKMPDLAVFVFTVLCVPGIMFAPYKIQACMRFTEWVGVFGVFLYARHFLSPQEIKRAVMLMIGSSFLVALYAMLQALNFDLSGWVTDFSGRAFSSLGNPDFLGGFLVITVPLTLYLAGETGKDKTSVFLFMFLSITLFLSQTRSSIAAYAAVLILMLFMFFKYFRKNCIYVFVGVIAAVILITSTGRGHGLMSRFTAAAAAANPDLHGRFDMWKAGLNMIKTLPFTGVGAGSIKNVYCIYAHSAPYLETEHLHNDFIEIAAENGIFVWLAFMTFLVSVFYGLIRKKETFAGIAAVVLIGMCMQAVFNFPFFILDTKLYFFAIMGIALNEGAGPKISQNQALAGVMAAVIISVMILRLLTGSIYLNAGINFKSAGNNQAAFNTLKKAGDLYYDAKPLYYFTPPLNDLVMQGKAVEYSREFLDAAPCSKNGFLQYSINLAETGNLGGALKVIDRFLNMYPADKDALSNKGKMLYMSGRAGDAMEIYSRIAAEYPFDETAHNNLYGIYYNNGMTKQAEAEKARWESRK